MLGWGDRFLGSLFMFFLWIKTAHVVAMTAWFAGLFYLPRLFVYHADCWGDQAGCQRFVVMERRLYRYIMTPAAVATVLLGWGLLHTPATRLWWSAPWLHAKLGLVLLLIGFHLYCGFCVRSLARGERRHSSRFYRYFNEIPTVILVAVVALVIIKPTF